MHGDKKLYNRYPDKIGWNFIRSGDLHIIDFNKEDYEDSCEWAMNVIDNIYDTDKFQKNEQYFIVTIYVALETFAIRLMRRNYSEELYPVSCSL